MKLQRRYPLLGWEANASPAPDAASKGRADQELRMNNNLGTAAWHLVEDIHRMFSILHLLFSVAFKALAITSLFPVPFP